jgi:predicted GIY-YIG superfamily endonuclease
MPETTAKIYGVADQNGRIMYIGKSNDPVERMKQHLRDCTRRKTPLYGWINKALKDGQMPQMIVLASATSSDWQSLERQMIAQYRDEGHLLNLADGGNQPKSNAATNKRNGHALNERLKTDPLLRRVRDIKRSMSWFFAECSKGKISPEAENRIKSKLRLAGHKNPSLFGEYRYL